jgi:photosystem II stability/assembly factor-like uncharacterized protein
VNLNDIRFDADGRTGWIVGDGGTILATQDGGRTWSGQNSHVSVSLVSVAFAGDRKHGLAVGDSGTVLVTADGGATWATRDVDLDTNLNAVAISENGQLAWTVGAHGTILATTDGGETWHRRRSGTTALLWSIGFAADWHHGYAVGASGTLLETRDGGDSWLPRLSSTNERLQTVAVAADGRRAWLAGNHGTIGLAVTQPSVEPQSVQLEQARLARTTKAAFTLRGDARLPVWAVRIEARTAGGEWSTAGAAAPSGSQDSAARWEFSWNPEDRNFHPGDRIDYRTVIHAGQLEPVTQALGSLVFDPLWQRLWREHSDAMLWTGAVFGVVLLYAGGTLLMLLVAPAKLAKVGSAPFADMPGATGLLAQVLWLARLLWDSVLPLWMCRVGRVRRAWIKEYAARRTTLGELGKFARSRFVNEPEVLDAWVSARLAQIGRALDALELFDMRRVYVPVPVRVGTSTIVERPDAALLRETFSRQRAVVGIVGTGGSGKSTLACAIARWAMAADAHERLTPHRTIPVFIVEDTTDLTVAVTRALRAMVDDDELPEDLVHGLLASQRLLVIIDALSEREPSTQRQVEEIFATAAWFNAVLITSRAEPQLGAVERTMLYPQLLDQKRIVPFIVDYAAQRADAGRLSSGRTLLQLGDRILQLAETEGHSTTVTPLMVTLFVDSAINLEQSGAGLDDLPRDVPEIFMSYLRRVRTAGASDAKLASEEEFGRAARALARCSLGPHLVPGDFSLDEAIAALDGIGLASRADVLVEAMASGAVLDRRLTGGMTLFRFSLDPVAEYLTAIQAVSELRHLSRSDVAGRIEELTMIESYPNACNGYLRAFATCYRAYSRRFGLPDIALPWEAGEAASVIPAEARHSMATAGSPPTASP